ncbi:MAG: DUF2344 domain-containing protein [Caldilineae bacterium]|nr:MAG: DUF2344 domain-containing protein [Caldilineae bacterium]
MMSARTHPPGSISPDPPVQRLRMRYGKRGDARFIGHLDVARFWERVFRRVGLPLAYSHGFNPQPRIQFASALSVGIEGENELADIFLDERVEPAFWLERIRQTLPDGFVVHDLVEVPLKLPSMQSALRAAVYEVSFRPPPDVAAMEERVQALLARRTILRPHHKRPERQVDLRPLILWLGVRGGDERVVVEMTLKAGQQGNARVSDVLEVLGLDPLQVRVVRKALILEESAPEEE